MISKKIAYLVWPLMALALMLAPAWAATPDDLNPENPLALSSRSRGVDGSSTPAGTLNDPFMLARGGNGGGPGGGGGGPGGGDCDADAGGGPGGGGGGNSDGDCCDNGPQGGQGPGYHQGQSLVSQAYPRVQFFYPDPLPLYLYRQVLPFRRNETSGSDILFLYCRRPILLSSFCACAYGQKNF